MARFDNWVNGTAHVELRLFFRDAAGRDSDYAQVCTVLLMLNSDRERNNIIVNGARFGDDVFIALVVDHDAVAFRVWQHRGFFEA